jgi:hypothetical protein
MSFNSAIPVATDPMLKSQLQTKTNFQAMNTVFGQNHMPFTADPEFSGMHSVVTFREQSGDPTTTSTQTALYTKQVGSLPQLFFRPNSNQTPIQMTNSNVKTGLQSTNPPVYLSQQYSFIAGPFTVYGGYLPGINAGASFTLSPTTTLIYAGATLDSDLFPGGGLIIYPSAIAIISGSTITIQFQNGVNPRNVYYFAIGM